MNITWSPPTNIICPLSTYIIHYRKVPSLDSKADSIQINVTNVTHTFYLMQLDCGIQYEIQMTATNKLGKSKRSNTWQVKTKSSIKGRYTFSFFVALFPVFVFPTRMKTKSTRKSGAFFFA